MTAIIPFSDLEKIALVMGKTKMFGKNADELLPLMLIAQAEGKHPAVAAQEYDIIQGRPALKSQSTLARFQAAGGKISWIKRTDKEVSAKFSHPAGGELVITWTMERANQAGLTSKDNWRKYPTQMLASRVASEGVRAVYPACLSGLYTEDEVMDMDDKPAAERNITAEVTAEAEPVAAPPVDPWPAEYNTRIMALTAIVGSWNKAQRDKLELGALARAGKDDPDKLALAEIRADIFAAAIGTGKEAEALEKAAATAGINQLLSLKAELAKEAEGGQLF